MLFQYNGLVTKTHWDRSTYPEKTKVLEKVWPPIDQIAPRETTLCDSFSARMSVTTIWCLPWKPQ